MPRSPDRRDIPPPASPAPAPPAAELPHPLTFFLRDDQRRAVLAALRRRTPDRSTALLRALRIDTTKEPRP